MGTFTFNKKPAADAGAPKAPVEGAEDDRVAPPVTSAVSTRRENIAVGGIQGDFRESDFKLPRLNIVQSVGPLSDNFKPGSIVWNGEVVIIPAKADAKEWTDPLELTVLQARQDFIQNVEYDSDDRADTVNTLAEVEQRGGTIEWNGDTAPSWLPRLHILTLIKAPDEKCREIFSQVDNEGNACELALWTVKKAAYTRAGKAVITASRYSLKNKETNESELHFGKWTLQVRREKLGEYFVFVPKLQMVGRHDAAYADFAKGLV